MLYVVTRRTSVNDHFVADSSYGFRTCQSANCVQNGFCVCFRIAENGYFDKLMQIERKGYVENLIVSDSVFADLEDWIYLLCHTAKARAL